jgi:hypothetical protein
VKTGRPRISLESKFWARVQLPDEPDGCWEWSGYRRPDGYGVIRVTNKDENINLRAHLVALELAGLGNDEELVHHVCRNRGCVNPDHLEPMAWSDHSVMHATEYWQSKREAV